jgi:ABC-type transport system substrate-binding protein
LAESWRLIDDTLWEFKLRRGVRFHNGHRLTATDVQYSLNRIIHRGALDGRTSPRRSLLAPVSEVIVKDDHTVRIKTRYPWPNLPLMLSLQEIVPAAYVQAVGCRGFEAQPVGTGPFRLMRNEAGRTIVLERFEDYYGGAPERPPVETAPLKQLVFKFKLQGFGTVLSTVLLPDAFGYDPRLQPYPYDLSVARQLLTAAAYPDHRPVTIYCNHEDLIFADGIALFLTKLGLRAQSVTYPAFRPRVVGKKAPWDIFVGSWGNSTLDPAGILPAKFMRHGYGNYSGFASSALDRLMRKAQRTMERTHRTELYHRIQKIIFDEAPMIFGYAQDEYYGVARRVKNFHPSSTGMMEFHDVYVDHGE